jgi:hypothetical protein
MGNTRTVRADYQTSRQMGQAGKSGANTPRDGCRQNISWLHAIGLHPHLQNCLHFSASGIAAGMVGSRIDFQIL